MHSKYTNQPEEAAINEFKHIGSISATIQKLDYPSPSTLYRWNEHQKAGISNWHGFAGSNEYRTNTVHSCNVPGHPRHPSAEIKMDALHRCFELGEDVEYVSRDIGYSRASIYKWRRLYLEKGAPGLMSSKKKVQREPLVSKQIRAFPTSAANAELQEQVDKLQMEVDILKETINALKKDPGADLGKLSNREKAVIVSALKDNYSLQLLLHKLGLPRSSYFYQISAIGKPDKYAKLRARIREIFHENRDCYGDRRIWYKLQKQGIVRSEKIIRRLMKEEGLAARFTNKRKYSSYRGEISPEVKNIIARDFHSETPNKKWLTDITEFALPAGKVYLSPILDCFDGYIVSWTVGTSPNGELENTMLDTAISQ